MGKQRGALLLAVLLVLLIAGWWKLNSAYSAPDIKAVPAVVTTAPATSAEVHVALPLVVHHTHTASGDTYSGSLETPGVCTTVSSGISTTGQNPAHVILIVSLTPASGGCVSTSTQQDFSVSFNSTNTKPAVLNGVSLNGRAVPYTLVQ